MEWFTVWSTRRKKRTELEFGWVRCIQGLPMIQRCVFHTNQVQHRVCDSVRWRNLSQYFSSSSSSSGQMGEFSVFWMALIQNNAASTNTQRHKSLITKRHFTNQWTINERFANFFLLFIIDPNWQEFYVGILTIDRWYSSRSWIIANSFYNSRSFINKRTKIHKTNTN